MEHCAARTGALAVRIPVEIGVEAPVAVEAVFVFQRVRRNVGARIITISEHYARQLHLAVFEIQRLADAEALTFKAVVFDPAVGDTQRQLVLVADAVGTGEAVVTEQRGIVERAFAGVEYRDVGLVFLGYIEIEQARFQGLTVILAEPVGVTVEVQAAVDAEDRHAAALTTAVFLASQKRAFALTVQVQRVLGVDVLKLRCQETIGPVHWQADGRRQIQAVPVCPGKAGDVVVQSCLGVAIFIDERAAAQVTFEANGFSLIIKLQTTRVVRQRTVERQLWQAVVRRNVRNRSQLVSLSVEHCRVAVATVGQRALLVEEVRPFNADLIGFQILEVIRVADVGVINLGQPARIKPALVLPVDHPASLVVVRLQLAVVVLVVQVRAAKLAFAAFGQVAELAFHQQAAVGHVTRVQRGVVVRCQVEVVRSNECETVIAACRNGRRQEAGLATVVDREVDIRRVQNRYVLDPQGNVGRCTKAGGRVQRDVVAFERPSVAVRLTRGVGTVLEPDDRVLCTLGVQGVTANVRLVQDVLGIVDTGFAGIELQLGLVTDDQRAVVAQTDIAVQLATVFGLMQCCLLSLYLHAALAQHDITCQRRDLRFLFVTRSLGSDEHRRVFHRRLVVHAWADRLDVGTRAIRTGLGQLCCGQLFARNPIKVAVVSTTRPETFALGFGNQLRTRNLLTRRGALRGDCAVGTDRRRVMHGARRQVHCSSIGFRRTVPGTRSRD
ncbi:Uncharacterized protein ALO79_06598 [Pseudomonas syringae pv. castaneae]|uniref:Uncharacterized protein n=1 Tax=Pseudomonas syringae pv. castaneae TaxID=264450 RepID=A0A0P9N5L9_PSESX|nr:Uncharacterized protein ALO79_06598 [Pseudomonas syringae pv. castaneae]